MSDENSETSGPDLAAGIALTDLKEGEPLLGHVGEDAVMLVRRGSDIFAVAATCTHYGGPLAEGLIDGETVRCPWHHACFDLRTGEALRAPALDHLARWSVEQRAGKVMVTSKKAKARFRPRGRASSPPESVVIVGGGAAGFAAARRLRREGYQGGLVILSDDQAPPVDRPNLSKDYLAGNAPDDYVPLRRRGYYSRNRIELRLGTRVARIEPAGHQVVLSDGSAVAYDRLLLATGAEPVRLAIPGAEQPHVRTLRTLADCKSIIALAEKAHRAVIVGASFIGLEVAASLRSREKEVHVVAPDKRPMERILGPALGDFVRSLHEEHGVVFHLEDTATSIDGKRVVLKGGGTIEADLVVCGIGVRPRLALAEGAGLAVDHGVIVNEFLETSASGIFAAGDIARWPDPHTGENIRVEHWVVAERQGQVAAANMLGYGERHDFVPFFWSQHYDTPINYVGHAGHWDDIEVEGDVAAADCVLRFKRAGRTLAVASISRDLDSLKAELAMERGRIAAAA